MTAEDKGFIFADYTAKSGDAAKNVIAELALSLAKNASKAAYNKLINVYVTTAASGASLTLNTNTWAVTPNLSASTIAGYGSLVGIIIEAAEQPFILGKMSSDRVVFSVSADPIMSSGLETTWATITMGADHPTAAIKNSKKIADLEWFCAGERGDIYRGVGYPNNFDFQPLVDSAATYGYHVIELAYYYDGPAEDVQKSPKEIVIVSPAEGDTTYTVINAVIGDINTAAGTTVLSTLS